jgi:hypothetical protein
MFFSAYMCAVTDRINSHFSAVNTQPLRVLPFSFTSADVSVQRVTARAVHILHHIQNNKFFHLHLVFSQFNQ